MRGKIEAKRAHMQAFVDRFRAKASKATQAQSRLKMLAKLPVISRRDGGAHRALHPALAAPGRWPRPWCGWRTSRSATTARRC